MADLIDSVSTLKNLLEDVRTELSIAHLEYTTGNYNNLEILSSIDQVEYRLDGLTECVDSLCEAVEGEVRDE